MRRREFITLLGSAALAWPLAARGQQPRKVPRIGLLMPVSADIAARNIEALKQGLRDLGYVEGQNIAFEPRYAHGDDGLLPGFAAELAGLNVDVILTWGTPSTQAAKQATPTIPIVMGAIADPLGTGIVASLARPGENITGMTSIAVGIEAKRLEMLKEIVPGASRIGTLWNPANPVSAIILKQTEVAARALGIELLSIGVRGVGDFDNAFAALAKERLDALTVETEVLLLDNMTRILDFAGSSRLPAVYGYKEFVDAGGLLFYGPNWPDLFRRAATYIDKILKGAKPGSLPVEQPVKFELIVNLKTAKALGLTIPESFLLRADEVIE